MCKIDLVLRFIIALIVVAGLALAGAMYVVAARAPGPAITIERPSRWVGRSAVVEVSVEVPPGALTGVSASIEQDGAVLPLFSLDDPQTATITQETVTRVRIVRAVDRTTLPELQPGAARLVVTARRGVLFGLRELTSAVDRPIEVRFDPPRLAVLSTFHYVTHGGSELVVYRVTPPDAESGVRVGDRVYPGYPAAGAGMTGADESTRAAFFALLHDQDLKAPIELWARDQAGNEARASFDHRVFPKSFRRARIDVADPFMDRVVSDILRESPQFSASLQRDRVVDTLDQYLAINREMRTLNNETIAALATDSAPGRLWTGAFQQLGNSQVESGFAEYRTYFYGGKEIDQQVHLGFDLAVTANVPVAAANRGRVVFAAYLGIYGNCVVIDHGMGLQSLYGHLSSIDVGPGDAVDQGQTIGRSGMTGLAGGDHLHFTLLLQGQPVTPVEWWDRQWIEDRIERKFTAGLPAS